MDWVVGQVADLTTTPKNETKRNEKHPS
jgi:hypothetical protein